MIEIRRQFYCGRLVNAPALRMRWLVCTLCWFHFKHCFIVALIKSKIVGCHFSNKYFWAGDILLIFHIQSSHFHLPFTLFLLLTLWVAVLFLHCFPWTSYCCLEPAASSADWLLLRCRLAESLLLLVALLGSEFWGCSVSEFLVFSVSLASSRGAHLAGISWWLERVMLCILCTITMACISF